MFPGGSFSGMGALVMRGVLQFLSTRLGFAELTSRRGFWRLALIPHLAALGIMLWSEYTITAMTAFLLAWGILNSLWLALLRRPAVAATLSLAMMTVLVLLSQLKYQVLMMSANFVDLMIVDTDTVTFLFTIFPALRWIVALSVIALIPLVVLMWRSDPFRVRRLTALALALGCVGGLTVLGMRSA